MVKRGMLTEPYNLITPPYPNVRWNNGLYGPYKPSYDTPLTNTQLTNATSGSLTALAWLPFWPGIEPGGASEGVTYPDGLLPFTSGSVNTTPVVYTRSCNQLAYLSGDFRHMCVTVDSPTFNTHGVQKLAHPDDPSDLELWKAQSIDVLEEHGIYWWLNAEVNININNCSGWSNAGVLIASNPTHCWFAYVNDMITKRLTSYYTPPTNAVGVQLYGESGETDAYSGKPLPNYPPNFNYTPINGTPLSLRTDVSELGLGASLPMAHSYEERWQPTIDYLDNCSDYFCGFMFESGNSNAVRYLCGDPHGLTLSSADVPVTACPERATNHFVSQKIGGRSSQEGALSFSMSVTDIHGHQLPTTDTAVRQQNTVNRIGILDEIIYEMYSENMFAEGLTLQAAVHTAEANGVFSVKRHGVNQDYVCWNMLTDGTSYYEPSPPIRGWWLNNWSIGEPNNRCWYERMMAAQRFNYGRELYGPFDTVVVNQNTYPGFWAETGGKSQMDINFLMDWVESLRLTEEAGQTVNLPVQFIFEVV